MVSVSVKLKAKHNNQYKILLGQNCKIPLDMHQLTFCLPQPQLKKNVRFLSKFTVEVFFVFFEKSAPYIYNKYLYKQMWNKTKMIVTYSILFYFSRIDYISN